MTLLAPAIIDVRADGKSLLARLDKWRRGIGVRQIRIACGLVMFSYLFTHYFNHALGNISYALMESWLALHMWWWRMTPVSLVLYGAATVHFALGLWALYQRRHFRYAAIEISQILLGLSIPLLLAAHFSVIRLGGWLYDIDLPNYARPLFGYWVTRPYMVGVQFALLAVAWIHGCIGLYYWLRLKPFFKWARPFLLAIAILLPPLAAIGTHHGAGEVIRLAAQPQWRAQNLTPPMKPAQRSFADDIALVYFPIGYGIAIFLVFAARGVRSLRERRHGSITVSYPDRQVRVPKGLSVLEASLRHRVPHASVCGGRARCSTCRVRVVSDRAALPAPSNREAHVLNRVGAGADPSIRLACQLRPREDVAVIPVLPAHIGADFVRNRTRVHGGEERYIVSMFVDMRGSTKLAEGQLPFDTVFLINRFLGAASLAVIDAGGKPNQFVGDGLLALFGLDTDPATACRQALRAAALVGANVAQMNSQFAHDLRAPVQYGIGIHGGEVIIGDIGFRDHTVFTAIGDAVNIAARLQDMTKTLDCLLVVSDEVCAKAGIAPAPERREVTVRGHDRPMTVYAVPDPAEFVGLIDPPPQVSRGQS